jgi:hypothetical protein
MNIGNILMIARTMDSIKYDSKNQYIQYNIVTFIPIARQRISKHSSLTIEAVFSAWFMQSGYKEVFSSMKRAKSRVSRRQPAGI